ncbi:alpha/beta hydrolase [Halobellus limi]|nr:alpha/beta hydrolase [Halobellus limi]
MSHVDTDVNPQMRDVLEQVTAREDPPAWALSTPAARQIAEELYADRDHSASVERERAFSIPGPTGEMAVRLYEPAEDGPRPALVYYHGGGFVRGSLDTHDSLCRALAEASAATVISVDYRRAPENRFPAALRDAHAAFEWVCEHAADIGCNPDQVAVGGDSAGGNLAAASTLLARDSGGPTPAYQLLIYPALDPNRTDALPADAPALLTREGMSWYWNQYLGDVVHGANSYAAPLRAETLADLPPATVLTCEFDPLRAEGRDYARRLEADGVAVESVDVDGHAHGYLLFPELDATDEEIAALARSLPWETET